MGDLTAGSDAFLRDFRSDISRQEGDPNATESYKEGLERQFQNVVNALRPQSGVQPYQPALQAVPSLPSEVSKRVEVAPTHDVPPTGPVASKAARPQAEPEADTVGGDLPDALVRLKPVIDEAARVTGEAPDELEALTWDESRGKIGAASTNGGTGLTDGGLTQQDPATFAAEQAKHPELQGKSLDDPLASEEAAGFELKEFDQKYHDVALDERAYNSGEGSVDVDDANVTTTGLGDPDYVRKLATIRQDIDSGTPLPP